MKYYIIAGEASGDLHGSKLIEGIRAKDPEAQFRFWGGDRMAQAGRKENLVKHYKESAFMGFWEVLVHLPVILGQMRLCKRDVKAFRPDVLILIDYAGFNLQMARFARKQGIPVYYYIAPKVWAWKESRVKLIRRYVDRLFVIFPFETDYFRQRGIEAFYFGNPVMDALAERRETGESGEAFRKENGLDGRPIVALLAGSRASEVIHNLPFMTQVAARFPQYQFVAAGVSWLERNLYRRGSSCGIGNVHYVCDKTYPLLSHATAAIVTSGTATLETALMNVPELVCYWCNPISGFIGKLVLKIRWVSLVNIVMNREVVRELLYTDMVVEDAVKELAAILPGGEKRERMKADYAELRAKMGEAGASARVAAKMVELLREDARR